MTPPAIVIEKQPPAALLEPKVCPILPDSDSVYATPDQWAAIVGLVFACSWNYNQLERLSEQAAQAGPATPKPKPATPTS